VAANISRRGATVLTIKELIKIAQSLTAADIWASFCFVLFTVVVLWWATMPFV
jgi:hypothetical protein